MNKMNHYTIDTLLELIAIRREGEEAFRASADHARSARLRRILAAHARECTKAVRELRGLVRRLGANPEARGTTPGTARLGWTDLRAALARNEDGAILDECERGESRVLEVYRNALDDHLPDFVRTVVLRQFEAVMETHDEIRRACDLQPNRSDVTPSSEPHEIERAQTGQH